ncbi:MAG: class I tRNA ligase family protein [Patescibacteria group bacterium]
MDMKDLPKAYDAAAVEADIFKKWEDSGAFDPDGLEKLDPRYKKAEPYCIVLPPPNRTGTLHLGHAKMLAIEDLLIRFHRMLGKKTYWVPGTDHAALATQVKVEQILIKEGYKDPRKELGREKFLERVREFAQQSRDTIVNQCKAMGSSMDWKREKYTLDDERNRAVNTVFKMMYEDGLIERGYRVVNWDPTFQTTLSDDEVDHKDTQAELVTFTYDKDFPIPISTTRPETKFGDTGVAVHPDDKRYKKFVGKTLTANFCGKQITLKVIADEAVDPEFGTGALGVTPAHSMIDAELAERHGLPMVQVIDTDGKMMSEAGSDFAGLTVKEARKKIVETLEANGCLIKKETVPQSLLIAQRGESPVEQLPMRQWFVRVNKKFKLRQDTLDHWKKGDEATLKELMSYAVKSKQTKILPDNFEKIYFHWIDNLRDWCISRQIWFGHQIPVWYKRPLAPLELTFVTHGSTQDNINETYSGDPDLPLAEQGKQEAVKQGELLVGQNFDLVITSDLQRAVETAELTFTGRKIPFVQDVRLREIDLGGATTKDRRLEDHVAEPFQGGESCRDVEKRMVSFLSEIAGKYPGKKIAIMAHRAPQLALEVLVKGKSWNEALTSDWRQQKPKAWQAGWKYVLNDIKLVASDTPGEGWTRDPDTLDTWFSSGLWTFSTLGWPDEKEWKKNRGYHPTAVLETGYDILFFWVARMVLMSTYVLGEIPFKDVYLHGLVRDEKGRKMSKSIGNVLDPLELIPKYGTDAVRLSLVMGTSPGMDQKLSEEKIKDYRNFTNKLWNISRFILTTTQPGNDTESEVLPKTLADNWILRQLDDVLFQAKARLMIYQFSQAGEMLRDFTWGDLADWYLEVAKVEKGKDEILRLILKTILKAWHPFMPFLTEHIWDLAGFGGRLIIAEWPPAVSYDKKNFRSFETIRSLITDIRRVRAEQSVEPAAFIKVAMVADEEKQKLIGENIAIVKQLARLEEVEFVSEVANSWPVIVSGTVTIGLNLASSVLQKARAALATAFSMEIDQLKPYIKSTEAKLKNKEFASKAPEKVVNDMKNKLDEAKAKLKALEERMKA